MFDDRLLIVTIVTSGLTGDCQYTIQCGANPLDLQSCRDGGDTCDAIITIPLVDSFTSSTLYYYTVTVTNDDITVAVRGNFTTGTFCKFIMVDVSVCRGRHSI